MTISHNCFCAHFFLPNHIYLTCTLTKLDNFQILSETICSQNNQLDPVPTYINSLMIFSDESRKGPCNLQCLSRKRYKLNSFRSCTPGMAKLQKPVFEGNDFLGIWFRLKYFRCLFCVVRLFINRRCHTNCREVFLIKFTNWSFPVAIREKCLAIGRLIFKSLLVLRIRS